MARSAPITGITDSELYTDVRSAMERLAACRQSFADAAGKLAQLLTPEHIQEVTRVMGEQVAESAPPAPTDSLEFDLLTADDLYVTLGECLTAGDDLIIPAEELAQIEESGRAGAIAWARRDRMAKAIAHHVDAHVDVKVSYADSILESTLEICKNAIASHAGSMSKHILEASRSHSSIMLEHDALMKLNDDARIDQPSMSVSRKHAIDKFMIDVTAYEEALKERKMHADAHSLHSDAVTALLKLSPDEQSADHSRVLAREERIRDDAKVRKGQAEARLKELRRGTGDKANDNAKIVLSDLDLSSLKKGTGEEAIKRFKTFFTGRDDLHIVRMYVLRALADFDPNKGKYWRVKASDIPPIFWEEADFEKVSYALYNLIFDSLSDSLKEKVLAPIPIGYNEEMMTVEMGDGFSLAIALATHFTEISQVRIEEWTTTVHDAHLTLRTGDPGSRIEKVIRPALQKLTQASESVRGTRTLAPIMRTLEKRDVAFQHIAKGAQGEQYVKACRHHQVNAVLDRYLSAAIGVADTVSSNASVSRKELWDNNPYLEGNPNKRKAHQAELQGTAGTGDSYDDLLARFGNPPDRTNQPARKAYNAKLTGAGVDKTAFYQHWHDAKSGKPNQVPNNPSPKPPNQKKSKGGGGKGGKGNKGGKGGSVRCVVKGCGQWHTPIKGTPHSEVCPKCIRTATLQGSYTHYKKGVQQVGQGQQPHNQSAPNQSTHRFNAREGKLLHYIQHAMVQQPPQGQGMHPQGTQLQQGSAYQATLPQQPQQGTVFAPTGPSANSQWPTLTQAHSGRADPNPDPRVQSQSQGIPPNSIPNESTGGPPAGWFGSTHYSFQQ